MVGPNVLVTSLLATAKIQQPSLILRQAVQNPVYTRS